MKITFNHITKSYAGNTVLNIDSLRCDSGEALAVVGANGSGKTTLLRIALDLIKPDSGKVLFNDESIAENQKIKRQISSFLGDKYLIGYLTVQEYFKLMAQFYGFDNQELYARLVNYSGLLTNEIFQSPKYIRDHSSGIKQSIGIVAALLPDTPLLILDEPFVHLDEEKKIYLRELLKRKARDQKKMTIMVSHDTEYIEDIATRTIMLEAGIIRPPRTIQS